MQVEFLIGPAGSGKTFHCLEQIRSALKDAPQGLPLIFLAPKQATFQLERELLADEDLAGYTRLQILSFERLAEYVLDECFASAPPMLLSEEGRVMVLRAILMREHSRLHTFRASARTQGFAQELSRMLDELQRNKVTPQQLRMAAEKRRADPRLGGKLGDIALILEAYLGWLKENELFDPNRLLELASEAIQRDKQFRIGALWMDGFAEMTPQEIQLLGAIFPKCEKATLAFCLEDVPPAEGGFWSVPARAFRRCFDAARETCEPAIRRLIRASGKNRFSANRVLGHLERHWGDPQAVLEPATHSGQLDLFAPSERTPSAAAVARSVEWFCCGNPEGEATLAAREILRLVRDEGGRFREAAVLVRRLEPYEAVLQRVFRRYGIPCFVDQRRPAAHHPLAELTRYALRTVAFGWRIDDWFGALKSGLILADETVLDRLEIEAIAHGWEGDVWLKELQIQKDAAKAAPYEALRRQLMPPFMKLRSLVARRALDGGQLCHAIRVLWQDLEVERTLEQWAAFDESGTQVHQTVWNETNLWLDNLQLAFSNTQLPMEEWLSILEAGLCSLSVGVVPPALDQVLIGSVERSRNPTLKLAIVLGMNEGIFPVVSDGGGLLTEADRDSLEEGGLFLGPSTREQLAHERYLAYIACTRAGQRLVLTSAHFDALGRALNPSPYLSHLQRLFPGFVAKDWHLPAKWEQAEHSAELIPALLEADLGGPFSRIATLPVFGSLRERLDHFRTIRTDECLSEAVVHKLYGPELRTSITRLEQFGQCQFRFFVTEGLRAREKRAFEVDRRKLGDFQHQVLKAFHERLHTEQKRWRDLTPGEARILIGQIARAHAQTYHDGLFMADEQDRFTAHQLSLALEEMVEVLVGWMRHYRFDPVAVELRFDDGGAIPALRLPLAGGRSLALNGSIDRVDALRNEDNSKAWCVVVDYKSSSRKPDSLLMHHGIQMQLPAYLSALENLASPERIFGVRRLLPAGFFYISLRCENPSKANRQELFTDPDASHKAAFRHYGRFDSELLDYFDGGDSGGGQFNFKRTKDGGLHKSIADPLPAGALARLTASTRARMQEFGEAIFRGETCVNPFQHGKLKPCGLCDYRPICRVDLWTHRFRALQPPSV